jgi:TRAP-type C4-dicarboxylate transport system permease small subunit
MDPTATAAAPRTAADRAGRALGLLSAAPLALIVLLTFADVFARYLFARPTRGSVEIIQYAMAPVIFTALPLVTRQRGHVTVSLIDRLVGGRAAQVKQLVCDALSTLALALITWRLAAQVAGDSAGSTQTVVLGLPQAPLAYTLCLFAALSTLVMAGLLLRTARGELPARGGAA